MSEPHEPSYYEIALTNRQVVVAFVILLVCLLSAFFSGVWIGRESTVRAQEQLARNSPPPQQQAEPKKEGENLENLEFFDSKENKGGKKPAKGSQDEAPPQATPKPAPPAPEPEPPAAEPSPVQAAPVPAPAPPVPTPAPDRKGKGRKGAAAATPTAAAALADNSAVRPVKPSEAEPAVPKGAVGIQ
ncbi:MAG TPA: hypothetical protein VLX28_11350, partial [Thermoanaerobaculia bacterium]|nr:hypothetical protein [Thermoanaerobaculia bacterium]